MPLRISYAPYRLLFKHPFETSHGLRDGTNSIFIRVEENGHVGHGEVTLPPYLKEKPEEVIQRLLGTEVTGLKSARALLAYLNDRGAWGESSQGCRAGFYSAWIDLESNRSHIAVKQLLDINQVNQPKSLVTVGIMPAAAVPEVLNELPASDVLKVKMNGPASMPMLRAVLKADPRPVFLDANQGLTSLSEARQLIQAAIGRLLALEQPFAMEKKDLQKELQASYAGIVYGDEAIQRLEDLEQAQDQFKGVNIKLMKCGGLDRAKAMADRASELGMSVMLGSMSESSLGCTAMAHLADQAALVDLDGPWLIKNDPFVGIGMDHGKLVMPNGPGIGAVLKADLEFRSICA